MHFIAPFLAAALAAAAGPSPSRPAPEHAEVAPGVHLFRTAPYGEVGLDGNSVAILGDEGVLVFDTNGTPAAGRAVLSEIRKLTPKPVRWVVNSHWHWDHWYGTEVYREAFPDVQVVAHLKTRELMAGPALEFNRPGLERDLPGYLGRLEKQAAETAGSPEAAGLRERIAMGRYFLAQKTKVEHVLPNVTFTDRLDLHLGGRVVEARHHDRAVTPGDAYLWLPQDRVLVTGDLLVNPVTFALSSYPTGWIRTLEALDALDAEVIVPGHGAALADEELLHATHAVLVLLQTQAAEAKAKGLAVDEARKEILPRLRELKRRVTGGDAKVEAAFDVQLADWFLHRVYDELDGPLTDAIAPIPRE